jgi:glycosyltransferase involved in cell wall biosynthesis
MIERVLDHAEDFDLIHFHIDYLHYPRTGDLKVATLTTLHGRLDIPDLAPLYQRFRDVPVVSISNSQREPLPWLNWQRTVYHGLPLDGLKFQPVPGKYLAFLGRISPEKGLDQAIAIARQAGVELKIAAKIDRVDQDYFDEIIKPLLNGPGIDFVGEVNQSEKNEFLGGALALLCPVQWPEPFGMVMIEAMSCGTPVIAYPRDSIPELVEDGVSGFIVDDIPNGTKAVSGAAGLSRQQCRDYFERRFSAARMCEDYLGVYKSLVELNRESVTPSADPRIITMPSRSSAIRLQREEHGQTKRGFGASRP